MALCVNNNFPSLFSPGEISARSVQGLIEIFKLPVIMKQASRVRNQLIKLERLVWGSGVGKDNKCAMRWILNEWKHKRI